MRLSLRTLLAFEDNIFGIEQRRQLERAIPVNEAAVNALGRIRNVMRHPYLSVPGKINGQEELDANIVAEYLDQQMPQEYIEPFEDFCFSDDRYLAEVASAHQIVSNVLGEPARISRDCRYRCYQLQLSIPPESKEEKTEIILERAVPKEVPLKEIHQEYRRTTPQDFYIPPQSASQMKKTDILTGEVLDEPAISVNVRKTDKRPEIVKATGQTTTLQSTAKPAAVDNNIFRVVSAKTDIPQQTSQHIPASDKFPAKRFAEKNLLLIILTAAVIFLSVLCFKLYNDSRHKKPTEHTVSNVQYVLPNELSHRNEIPAEKAETLTASTTPNPTGIVSPTVQKERVVIKEDIAKLEPIKSEPLKPEQAEQNTQPLPNPFDIPLETASQNQNIVPQNTVPQKVLDFVKNDNAVPAVCAFPAISRPPIQEAAVEFPPAPPVAVKSLPTVFDAVAFAKPEIPANSADTISEQVKPVYQFTGHEPAAVKSEKGEFASVQPVISFLPKIKIPEPMPVESESVAEHKITENKTVRFTVDNVKKSSIKDNKDDAENTAAIVKLRQPQPAIIQAGGIVEPSFSDKQSGNNTGNNAAVPQKNVVLGRTVEADRSTVVFTAESADSPWKIETGKIDLIAEQYLLTSFPFRCSFELNGRHHSRLLNGFEIEMLGDSKLCVMPLDGNGTPGIYLDYGRIIIRLKNTDGQNPPKEFSLRIQTEKTEGILSLTGPKSIVFVDTFAEVIGQRTTEEAASSPQNSELPPKPSPIIGLLPDPQETLSWKIHKENKPFIADRDTSFLLDGVSNARGLIQHHPNWIRPVSQPNEATEIAAVCRRLSEEKNGNCEAVLQSLIQESSVPVCSFGLRLWGDLGRFDVPLTFLSDSKKENTKENSTTISVNRILTAYFREVMKRDEESIQRLSESIQQLRR